MIIIWRFGKIAELCKEKGKRLVQHHFIVACKLIQFTQSVDPPAGPAVKMARVVCPAVLTRLVPLVPVLEDAAVVAVPVGFPAVVIDR